jgi:hypothetical protein
MRSRRWDETWHRLHVWTNGQGPSERLAAQILLAEGYRELDPSHPLGGRDGGRDAVATKDGNKWVMAVYFPREQQTLRQIQDKLQADYAGVANNAAHGMAFVCNQELTVGERASLQASVNGPLELYHLERVTTVLDQPRMGPVRRQFGLEDDPAYHLEALQTGGDTYAYVMLYHFDMSANVAQNFVVIRKGEYPLYDVRIRIMDMDKNVDVFNQAWGELNSPADYMLVKWPLTETVYYRVFFSARNGQWHQDLQLKRSEKAECWLAATQVRGHQQAPDFQHVDAEFVANFGEPDWRS